jgi:hypothetical protein
LIQSFHWWIFGQWGLFIIYKLYSEIEVQKSETKRSEEESYRDDEGLINNRILKGQIIIDMTLTTPACPAADYLPNAARESVQIMYPNYEVILNLVREPTWTVAMIKDEDLKKMFE